jgi:hypothetical protein
MQQQHKATTHAQPQPDPAFESGYAIAPFVFLGAMIFAGVVAWRRFRWFWMVTK